MKKKILKYSILFLSSIAVGCNDWLDVQPKSQVKEEELFKSEAGFREALTGIYTLMGRTTTYGGNNTMGFIDMIAQTYSSVNSGYTKALSYDYKDNAVKDIIDTMWNSNYNAIANCNYLLKNIAEKGSVMNEDLRQLVEGEALALRAFLHFDLLRGYAPSFKMGKNEPAIPYVKEVTHTTEAQSTEKEQLEMNDYITDDGFWLYRQSRLNYYGITALLARVYLYAEDPTNALTCAREVIESGRFELLTDQHLSEDKSTSERRNWSYLQSMAAREYISSLYVYDLKKKRSELFFKDLSTYTCVINEQRKSNIFENIDLDMRSKRLFAIPSGSQKEYVCKYETGNRIPLLKLSEMYLIAAEAYAMLNQEDKASEMLNELKKIRIKGWTETVYNGAALMQEIQDERVRELFAEGNRLFDMKRWKIGMKRSSSDAQRDDYLPALGTDIEKEATDNRWVWPIPKDEMDSNPQLKRQQNPGY